MEWLWIIQLGINLIGVMVLFVWWKERGVQPNADLAERAEAWAKQVENWERESAILRKKTEDQLRFLVQLCEQAHAILMKHAPDGVVGAASLEEEELKALRNPPVPSAPKSSIPSVQELETAKRTLRPEIPLDLRSLLRDQLT